MSKILEPPYSSIKCDNVFSVVLVGEKGVGKTSLALCFTKGVSSSEAPESSVGSYECIISIDEMKIKMLIWDSTGNECIETVNPDRFRLANAVVLIYDSTDVNSFFKLPEWRTLALKFCDSYTQIFIVGTKLDLQDKRVINFENASAYGRSCRLRVFETSSLTTLGVEDAFLGILCDLLNLDYMLLRKRMTLYDMIKERCLGNCCVLWAPIRYSSRILRSEKWLKKSRQFDSLSIRDTLKTFSNSPRPQIKKFDTEKLELGSIHSRLDDSIDREKIMGRNKPPNFNVEDNGLNDQSATIEPEMSSRPSPTPSQRSSQSRNNGVDEIGTEVTSETDMMSNPDEEISNVEGIQISPPAEPSPPQPDRSTPPSPQVPPAPPPSPSPQLPSPPPQRPRPPPNRQQRIVRGCDLRLIMSMLDEWEDRIF